MLDTELLRSIATQMMTGNAAIQVQGKSVPIRRTSSQHLKMIKFSIAGREYTAIEQNPRSRVAGASLRVNDIRSCSLRMTRRTDLLRWPLMGRSKSTAAM